MYEAAYANAIIVDLNTRGIIQLDGRDRGDFINRMSTNKLVELQAGEGRATVLTTPIGRIIDLLAFLHDDERALLITGEGRGQRIMDYLRRNIFFNDQVRMQDLSASYGLYGFYGKTAAEILVRTIPEIPQTEHDFVKHENIIIINAEALTGNRGFWLSGERALLDKWLHDLMQTEGVIRADHDTYELLCIEAGYPLTGHELTEEYIPLEAGLWHAVSFNKGCYTGQEIIARMESRGKLAKTLVRLEMSEALPPGMLLTQEDGKSVGSITSVARKTDDLYPGLGFIKPDALSHAALFAGENRLSVKILGTAGTQPER